MEVLFDRHLPEYRIVSDRNRLNQVIANFIVNNAIKFTTAGGMRGQDIIRWMKLILRFYVADTGLGIEGRKCRLRYSTVL